MLSSTANSKVQADCASMHVPVLVRPAPFKDLTVSKCLACRTHFVPDIIMCTIDRPRKLATTGPGEVIEARVVRRLERWACTPHCRRCRVCACLSHASFVS